MCIRRRGEDGEEERTYVALSLAGRVKLKDASPAVITSVPGARDDARVRYVIVLDGESTGAVVTLCVTGTVYESKRGPSESCWHGHSYSPNTNLAVQEHRQLREINITCTCHRNKVVCDGLCTEELRLDRNFLWSSPQVSMLVSSIARVQNVMLTLTSCTLSKWYYENSPGISTCFEVSISMF